MPKKERLGFLSEHFSTWEINSCFHWYIGPMVKTQKLIHTQKKDHLSILTPLFSSGRLRDNEAT